jgi:heme A synthase
MSSRSEHNRGFSVLASAVLGFTVLVILGGSVVRATGSGAGCGDHWPRCRGQIIPTSPSTETVIELTHRLMTGVLGLGFVVLVVLAFRWFHHHHPVRRAAAASVALFVVEAVIGAALVRYGWVDDDTSLGRLIVVPLHLINTFLLLAALALTAWWGVGRDAPHRLRWDPLTKRLAVASGLLLVVGVFGAWNALADTLHPADSIADGIQAELADASPFLVRIRVLHPLVAVASGLVVAAIVYPIADRSSAVTRRLGRAVVAIILGQFLIGAVNLFLLTPIETQVIHLAAADVMWVGLVLFAASALADASAELRIEMS